MVLYYIILELIKLWTFAIQLSNNYNVKFTTRHLFASLKQNLPIKHSKKY
jgi:hypothetical protein